MAEALLQLLMETDVGGVIGPRAMNGTASARPGGTRRAPELAAALRETRPQTAGQAVPAAPGSGVGLGAELRTLCLARLDPSVVAAMPPDRLAVEVERLVAEIATEQRIQLNAREQRRLSQDLVDDMLGLGLLEDETVTDSMVNGPDRVFVERRGKVVKTGVLFRDRQHLINISQRVAAQVERRIDESSPTVDARRGGQSCQHRLPAARPGRALHVDRQARRLRLAVPAARPRA